MPELITVPTMIINQGDPFAGEIAEYPLQVQYYNDCISIEQNGQSINILPEHLDKIFKLIKKNLPEAERHLKSK